MKLIHPLNSFLVCLLFALIIFLLPERASAQSDYYKTSIAAGAGVTQSYADVYGHNAALAYKVEFSYFLNPFINVGINYQSGKIVGGDRYTDRNQREFTNDFKSVDLNIKLQLGVFGLQEESGFFNAVKGLYVGTGIGGINNNHKAAVRIYPPTGQRFPGYDRSKEMFVPFMTGINFHIPDKYNVSRISVSLNLQANIVSGEGLDSYDFNGTQGRQNIPDIFTFTSIGLSYHFGRNGWFGEY